MSIEVRPARARRRWLRKLHDEIHVTSLFVTHDRFRTLAISVGDRVYVVPRDAKVFVEDYSI